jgi:hypothetical protein
MSQIGGNPLQTARGGLASLAAAMIMAGVILSMSAVPVDPSTMPAGTMAIGALAVGGLATIGSAVEILRKFIEDRGHTDLEAFGSIITSRAFIVLYPIISAPLLRSCSKFCFWLAQASPFFRARCRVTLWINSEDQRSFGAAYGWE